jgi:phosphohistidine phosphatase
MMPSQFKNILLWRHAEAEIARSGKDDLARALTPKGEAQAQDMGKWLNKNLPKQALVLTSPALRALQTVEHLKYKTEIVDTLQPNANLDEILALFDSNAGFESIVIVGHQPWLGQLVGCMLGLGCVDLSIKKGAVWWLRLGSREVSKYQILTVQTPQIL